MAVSYITTLGEVEEMSVDSHVSLSYVTIDPPLLIGQESITYVHKGKFRFRGTHLEVNGVSFPLTPNTHYKLSALHQPLPVDQPDVVNPRLETSQDFSIMVLFRQNEDGSVEFVDSKWAPWCTAMDTGISAIQAQGWPDKVIHVRRPNSEFEPIGSFFARQLSELGRSVNVLIFRSFSNLTIDYEDESVTTADIPFWPRMLIYESLKISTQSRTLASDIRRFMGITNNSGIPVDMLDQLKIKIPGTDQTFSSGHFARTALNLLKPSVPFDPKEFDLVADSFGAYIDGSVNEATLTQLWILVVNVCLRGSAAPHRLLMEWQLNSLLPKYSHRSVDTVVLLDCPPFQGIPIVLVEAGHEPAPRKLEYKDNTKLFGMMSAVCIDLAYKLASAGIDPSLARSYGLLIGGTRAQLCIAHPEFRETGEVRDGRRVVEIHAHLTFSEHWIFDLLSDTPTPATLASESTCVRGCCINSSASASMDDIQPPHQDIDFDISRYAWKFHQKRFSLDAAGADQPLEEPNLCGNLSLGTLRNLKRLFAGITDRIHHICSGHESLKDASQRIYLVPKASEIVVKKWKADKGIASPKKQHIDARENNPTKVKKSNLSAGTTFLYKELSFNYPLFFPSVSGAVSTSGTELTLEASLAASLEAVFSKGQSIPAMLAAAILFAVDCFHSLCFLHNRIGASFAGSIKLESIRLSDYTGTWKFFDLEPIVTEDVTEEMRCRDISVLAQVIWDFFFFPLLDLVMNSEYGERDSEVYFALRMFSYTLSELHNCTTSSLLDGFKNLLKCLSMIDQEVTMNYSYPAVENLKALVSDVAKVAEVAETSEGGEMARSSEAGPASKQTKLSAVSPRMEENPNIPNVMK